MNWRWVQACTVGNWMVFFLGRCCLWVSCQRYLATNIRTGRTKGVPRDLKDPGSSPVHRLHTQRIFSVCLSLAPTTFSISLETRKFDHLWRWRRVSKKNLESRKALTPFWIQIIKQNMPTIRRGSSQQAKTARACWQTKRRLTARASDRAASKQISNRP